MPKDGHFKQIIKVPVVVAVTGVLVGVDVVEGSTGKCVDVIDDTSGVEISVQNKRNQH